MNSNRSTEKIVDHLFRHESGKMVAVLTHLFGIHNIGIAEDVVQETFLKAVQTWKFHDLPENPGAWLMQVAKNKALDMIRRQQNFRQFSKKLASQLQDETESVVDNFFYDTEIKDSQLRLVFACCHPNIKEEDQIALTLKNILGFSISEIAKALLTNEATVQKRIYRAKEFIRNANIELQIPSGKELSNRLETVHTVLYLIFNEGYNSSKADELIRKDICAEAMRLCLLLSEHKIANHPSTFALLSLMCFQASRFESRVDDNNSIVLLQNQDRNKWDTELIQRGYYYLNFSSRGDELSVYHIESAIAAEHCLAKTFEATNWERMLLLYDLLYLKKQTPVVTLNRAVVLAQLGRTKEAIAEINFINNIEDLLTTQYIYPAVLGDLYLRINNLTKGKKLLQISLELAPTLAEKKLISYKLYRLNSISPN